MRKLETQQALRKVRDLPFCYLCGADFAEDDQIDYDHVPPETVFAAPDRQPLKLRSHTACNHSHHLIDEKIGQLIGLRRGAAPRPVNRRLRVSKTNIGTALVNLDVDAAVWRWIAGYHAALYRTPLRFKPTGNSQKPFARSLVLPFPKGSQITKVLDPILPQHERFVETIKRNRFLSNLDRICCNNKQMIYECVWDRFDGGDQWCCVFALNICDWKELGAITPRHARGCTGFYVNENAEPPVEASRAKTSILALPNHDRLDPFAP